MLIPSQIILTYVRPSYWLSGLEILWGIITGLIAITQNANQVYVLRVFLGLCESSAWPGMMTLLSECQEPLFDSAFSELSTQTLCQPQCS
jgi:MFS family permease